MPLRPRVPLALLLLTGCGSSTGPGGDLPPILTELPRTLSASELRIVEGANAFAFDLLREATKALAPDSNAFLSPLSASMALGMALNGANGETYDALRSALRLDGMADADINQAYRDLNALLGGLDSRTEMRIANSVWGHSALPIEPAFTDAGRTFFDAEIRTLDFGDPEALTTINDWVSGKTNGRIPQLLDHLSPDEVLFLINAIYFGGSTTISRRWGWESRSEAERTSTGSRTCARNRCTSRGWIRRRSSKSTSKGPRRRQRRRWGSAPPLCPSRWR
jgi:serine protease inhibitor